MRPEHPRSLAVVVLAAGKGKRLKSKLPKALHPVCGRPVLWHVLRAAQRVRPDRLVVVVNQGKEQVEEAVRSWRVRPEPVFVDQGEPLGTGHAVMVAERAVGRADDVLVAPGDEPLVTGDQLRELVRLHRRRDVAAVVQTARAADPRRFGRIVRDEAGDFVRITEGTDASPAELAIAEVATAVYTFRREDLFRALPLLTRENRQREYYLHDVLAILKDKGEDIAVQQVDNGGSVGANSRAELAQAAAVMRSRINALHMAAGVTLVDPAQTYIDVDVKIGPDTVVYPLTFLEGSTRIGAECVIGPATRIVDSRIGDRCTVQFSVVREASIRQGASVGPYASVRPGTVLEEGAKAGTFVEIKASRVGRGSKVPHLSYVGDARLGQNVNVGAGTITCNYDGWEKHRTVIEDDVLIGSDTMLVAPVRVGKGAVTGAGSTITQDVPAGALALERSEQAVVKGYRKRREAEKGGRRRGH